MRYHTNIPLWPKIRRCQYSHTEILLHFSNKFKRVVVLKVAVLENEVSQSSVISKNNSFYSTRKEPPPPPTTTKKRYQHTLFKCNCT